MVQAGIKDNVMPSIAQVLLHSNGGIGHGEGDKRRR
jgi:hypothetical protein